MVRCAAHRGHPAGSEAQPSAKPKDMPSPTRSLDSPSPNFDAQSQASSPAENPSASGTAQASDACVSAKPPQLLPLYSQPRIQQKGACFAPPPRWSSGLLGVSIPKPRPMTFRPPDKLKTRPQASACTAASAQAPVSIEPKATSSSARRFWEDSCPCH